MRALLKRRGELDELRGQWNLGDSVLSYTSTDGEVYSTLTDVEPNTTYRLSDKVCVL